MFLLKYRGKVVKLLFRFLLIVVIVVSYLLDFSMRGNDHTNTSRVFVRDVARRKPVVYQRIARRLIQNHELLSKFDRLIHDFGHSPIIVSLLHNFEAEPPFRKESTTLADYLSTIMSSPEYASSHYLQQLNLDKYIPELITAAGISLKGPCVLSHYLNEESCNGPTLFIGARGTRTCLQWTRTAESKTSSVSLNNDPFPSSSGAISGQPHPHHNTFSSSFPIASLFSFPGSTSTVPSTSTHSSLSQSSFYSSSVYNNNNNNQRNDNNNGRRPSFSSQSQSQAQQKPTPKKKDPGKHNLFLQLSGIRKFVLFPPECSEDLLPMKGSPWPNVSKTTTFVHIVNDFSSNFDLQMEFIRNSSFPSLAKAWPQRIEVFLQPGEALLIPATWWHCTQIIQSGTGINWWFLVNEELEEKIRQIQGTNSNSNWESIDSNCTVS
jgi:hypothetical protein